jgi:hypothetical protein
LSEAVIVDYDIAFGRLVSLMVTWALAAIPAAIIVTIIVWLSIALLAALLGGMIAGLASHY